MLTNCSRGGADQSTVPDDKQTLDFTYSYCNVRVTLLVVFSYGALQDYLKVPYLPIDLPRD